MSGYAAIRPALFALPPEWAHGVTLTGLHWAARLGLLPRLYPPVVRPTQLGSLSLRNPVGLAAGLDKNGDYIDALAKLGFGFIEVGTVTPRPQLGNPAPRLFRLPQHQAIINRMGFNNKGVAYLVQRIRHRRANLVLGVNIGKNKDTPNEQALQDYALCFEQVYPYADYVTVNLSSPNTPGLRALQSSEALQPLLDHLSELRLRLAQAHGRKVPVFIKLSPDMAAEQLLDVCRCLNQSSVEGVIATNTTLSRSGVDGSAVAQQAGGLSGAPLHARAVAVIAQLREQLQPDKCIIGAGGIVSPDQAVATVQAGAQAVQLYTGLVYQGPGLIADCARAL